MTDLMLVLNTDAAVAAFASGAGQGAQVTLGAEMGVALGPVGRNMGASVTSGSRGRKEGDGGGGGGGSAAAPNESSGGADEEKRKQSEAEPGAAPESRDRCPTALKGTGGGGGAPIFAYAHQRGLFVGLFSLEGAVITPRSEVNKRFYERQTNAYGHTAAAAPPSSSPAPAPTAAAVATTRTMDAGTVGALPEEGNAAVAVTASKKSSGVSTAAPTPAALLSGKIPPPKGAEVLYKALLNVFQDSAEVNELAAALAVP